MCSFWKKGDCTRGDMCPYAHEQIHDDDGPMSKQNIKDRFRGINDPVAGIYYYISFRKNNVKDFGEDKQRFKPSRGSVNKIPTTKKP